MTEGDDLRFVYMTAADAGEAETLGRRLVEERLAACANVLPGMRSVYWWQGKVEAADEAVLICKTAATKVEALIAVVKSIHSYAVPCVVALPIVAGNAEYMQWVRDSVSAP